MNKALYNYEENLDGASPYAKFHCSCSNFDVVEMNRGILCCRKSFMMMKKAEGATGRVR